MGQPGHPGRRPRARKGSFEIGQVIGRSLSIWARNLLPLSLLSLLVFAPYGAWLYSAGQTGRGDGPGWREHAESLLLPVLTTLLEAPVVVMVVARLRGRVLSLAAALGPGLARLVPAVAVAFLVALIQLGFAGLAELIGQPLGTWVVLVPNLIVWCGLVAAVPAAVVERQGVFGALRRSWQLTSGHKARIFVIVILAGVLLVIAAFVFGGVFFAASGKDLDSPAIGSWLAMYASSALFSSMVAVFSGVIYHDLRVAVEGVDTEEIAEVFD